MLEFLEAEVCHALNIRLPLLSNLTDLILTTLKPLLKNVTAEDVAASLYYLHLNTDDDARLLESETTEALPRYDAPVERPLLRKPLPESAKSSLDLNRYTVRGPPDQDPALPKRKPVMTVLEPQKVTSPTTPSNTRPMGPRPLLSETSLSRKPMPGVENRPPLGSYDHVQAPKTSSESSMSFRPQESSQNDRANGKGSTKSFSITLIRRDPSSGAQWNAGTVTGQPIYDGAPATRRAKKPFFDMSVHLMTPGYTQFHNRQLTAQAEAETIQLHHVRNDSNGATMLNTYAGFERKIHMGGRSSGGRPEMQHKRARSDFSTKNIPIHGSSEAFARGSREAATLGDDPGSFPTQSHGNGYMFLSPWGGSCQFSTGISGRSLKCKHYLPTPISAGGAATPPSASTISELRFNLPSSGVFNPSTSPKPAKPGNGDSRRFSVPKFGNIRDKLASPRERPQLPLGVDPTSYAAMYPSDNEETPNLPPRPGFPAYQRRSEDTRRDPNINSHSLDSDPISSPSDDDSSSRLDLSIGREKAGGGNRGKRAKLGKLIIYDEGFKMLDLVVAANMCIWWSVWEGV